MISIMEVVTFMIALIGFAVGCWVAWINPSIAIVGAFIIVASIILALVVERHRVEV